MGKSGTRGGRLASKLGDPWIRGGGARRRREHDSDRRGRRRQPEDVILVGIGRRGHSRLHRWGPAGGRVGGIVETDPSRLANARGAEGIPLFKTLEEAFAALPAARIVDICTPPSLHREQTLLALASDRHVLCEKPFMTSVADAEEVLALAKSRSKQVGVF